MTTSNRPRRLASPEESAPRVTVADALTAYMTDARDRPNPPAAIAKKQTIFEKQLAAYCRDKGIRFLIELDVRAIREWRSTWQDEALSRAKKQGRVLGFFWFRERSGWLPPNFAYGITKGLGRIQVKATETGLFLAGRIHSDLRRDIRLQRSAER